MVLSNDLELVFIAVLAMSVALAALTGEFFFYGLLMLISGIVSSLLVRGARRRSVVIRAGFIIGCLQALLSFVAIDSPLLLPSNIFRFF